MALEAAGQAITGANQTRRETISHNKWCNTRQTVDEGHPFIDRLVEASEPPADHYLPSTMRKQRAEFHLTRDTLHLTHSDT
jgi:predicted component of type VI protein secretion system